MWVVLYVVPLRLTNTYHRITCTSLRGPSPFRVAYVYMYTALTHVRGLRIRSSRYSSVKDEVSGTINTYTMIRLWTGGVILVFVTICYVISSDSVRSRVKSRATVGSSIALNRGRMFFKIDHTIICNYKYRG